MSLWVSQSGSGSATWPKKATAQIITSCIACRSYTDSDVSTKYHWARPHVLSPESTATVTWDIPRGHPVR